MKLDKNVVKGMLEIYLAKEGHTLHDLEQFIKEADDKKKKDDKGGGGSMFKIPSFSPTSILGGGAQMLAGVTGLVGGLGGLGAYGAYKELGDSDNKISKQQETIRKIEAATRELQAVKAQQQMGYSGL